MLLQATNRKHMLLKGLVAFMQSAVALIIASFPAYSQQVRVTFYTPEIVRIQKSPDGNFRETPSRIVTLKPELTDARVNHGGNTSVYTSSALSVTVDNRTADVTFSVRSGERLLRENGNGFVPIQSGFDMGLWRINQQWKLDGNDVICSCGANCFQSVKGYGIIWDNYSPTSLIRNGAQITFASDVAEAMDYFFVYGRNANGVVSLMRKLSGEVPMLPLWAYGYLLDGGESRGSSGLIALLDGFRQAGLPADGIVHNSAYWSNNYLWNAMEFLDAGYPDPQSLMNDVHSRNARLALNVAASFGPMTKAYDMLGKDGLMLDMTTAPYSGLAHLPNREDYPSGILSYDVYSAQAASMYGFFMKGLADLGVDGWSLEGAGPNSRLLPSELDGTCSEGSIRSVIGAYPLAAVENLSKAVASERKRSFIISDSFFPGQQRTGAIFVPRGVESSWDALRGQIALCQDCFFAANHNFASVIGGSTWADFGKDYTSDPAYQELYVRWMQFGLFNTLMISNGIGMETAAKMPSAIAKAMSKALELRYELLPYIYSSARMTSEGGLCLMRASLADYPWDRRLWQAKDQFLFGPSILVAPVSSALYTDGGKDARTAPDWKQNRSLAVYLPAGSLWYDWYSGEKYNGGTSINADASIDVVPMFVKAGGIVPVGPAMRFTSEKDGARMEIRVYPGAKGEFTLYEDAGDGMGYKHGEYSMIKMTLNNKTLTFHTRRGVYSGMKTARSFVVVTPDGKSREVEYRGGQTTVEL